MQTPLDFRNKLLRPTTQQQRTRLCILAILEDIEPLSPNLPLIEFPTRAQVLILDIGTSRLNRPADGLDDPLEIIIGDTTCAKDIPIGEILGGEVPDRKPREDDFGAGCDDCFEFSVDDLPFGIDDRLVFRYLVDPDFGIVFFGLEFEFDVEAEDFGVLEGFRLLFESGVGKGLFECDALDEEGVLKDGR